MIMKFTKNGKTIIKDVYGNKIINPKLSKTCGIIEKQILRNTKNKDFKTCKENIKVYVTSGILKQDMLNNY